MTQILTPFFCRCANTAHWRHMVVIMLLWAVSVSDASALLTWGALSSPQSITLQIGSTNTTVNKVTFTVNNADLANATEVQGIASSDTPATTPSGGVPVTFSAVLTSSRAGTNYVEVKTTVSAPAALTCVAGTGCASTLIPFNSIRWVSYPNATDANSLIADIKNGTFVAGGTNTLSDIWYKGGSPTVSTVLVFYYNNATLYPSGTYTGRVTYTAAIP